MYCILYRSGFFTSCQNPWHLIALHAYQEDILNLHSIENSKSEWILDKMNLLLFRKSVGNRNRSSNKFILYLTLCLHYDLYPLLSLLIKMSLTSQRICTSLSEKTSSMGTRATCEVTQGKHCLKIFCCLAHWNKTCQVQTTL